MPPMAHLKMPASTRTKYETLSETRGPVQYSAWEVSSDQVKAFEHGSSSESDRPENSMAFDNLKAKEARGLEELAKINGNMHIASASPPRKHREVNIDTQKAKVTLYHDSHASNTLYR